MRWKCRTCAHLQVTISWEKFLHFMRNVVIDKKTTLMHFSLNTNNSPSPATISPSKHELPIKLNYFLIPRHHKIIVECVIYHSISSFWRDLITYVEEHQRTWSDQTKINQRIVFISLHAFQSPKHFSARIKFQSKVFRSSSASFPFPATSR